MDFITIAHAAEEAINESAASPVGVLGLETKLFLGQLVNFAILLFVFWKWILPNIVKGLQSRKERIEKSLLDAEKVEKEKTEFSLWKETEMTKVRSQTTALITAAQSEAAKARQKILDETKQEQERVINQAKSKIEEEKNNAVREVKSQMADLVTLATERIIKEKLDSTKDKKLIQDALRSI